MRSATGGSVVVNRTDDIVVAIGFIDEPLAVRIHGNQSGFAPFEEPVGNGDLLSVRPSPV